MTALNNYIATIKPLSIILMVAIFIFCRCGSSLRSEGVKKISLITNYPIVVMNDGVHDSINFSNLKDTIWIFFYNDLILYRLSPTRNFETNNRIIGTETWFVFNKNASEGLLFKSMINDTTGVKLPVDSFLNNRAYAGTNFDIPSDSLFTKTPNIGDEFVEIYYTKKKNVNYPDSIYYHFTNGFKGIDFTFSRKLDSIRKMKLYKARLLYNETFSAPHNAKIPRREILFKISEDTIVNSSEVINFFERAKRQIKSRNVMK